VIPVEKALEIVLAHTPSLGAEEVVLTEALGRVLAEDVRSDVDMPPFDRSAMDGYAVRAGDTAGAPVVLEVMGQVRAGQVPDRPLEPGKAADLVLMRWQQIAYPYLDQDAPVVDAVVRRGKASGVETVLVAGEPVLRDGRFTRVNKADMLEALAASLRVPLEPAEERRRRLARDVFPHVKRFYDGWLDEPARDPFYRPSSRH